METAKDYIKEQILIDLAKGVEKDSLYTMSEIIRDVLGNQAKIVALSGPTHAEEVVRDMLLNHKRRPDGRAFDQIRMI